MCMYVCVCTTSAENELFLFNVSYILFFFYSVICYAHYRSTVSLSFQCPTRTCIIIIIIIMCTDRIARDVYGHYFSFLSSILRRTMDPRRLFFFLFSNGRMMSIIMHFFFTRLDNAFVRPTVLCNRKFEVANKICFPLYTVTSSSITLTASISY